MSSKPKYKIPKRKYILRSFEEVLADQEPQIIGQPIRMNEFECDLPKNCGNPWIGAYSKHGFWYKFYRPDQKDFDWIVAYAIDTDRWTLQYEEYELWKKAFGDDIEFIVAKNQRDEVLGSIVFAKYGLSHGMIGVYWMMEDHRHSGIGMQMFQYAMRKLQGRNVCVNAVSHLFEKLQTRTGFKYTVEWSVEHLIVREPQAFLDLKVDINAEVLKLEDKSVDMKMVMAFDERVTGGRLSREKWLEAWLNHPDGHANVVITPRGEVCGFGLVREVAGGSTKRLVVGPLYAHDGQVARILLYHLLYNYYDEEKRPDFDPNPDAIECREVHFFAPNTNKELFTIISELKGSDGDAVEKDRFFYQPLFTKEAIKPDIRKVFCVSDWQMAQI